jgi:hypothetical protein
MHNLLEEGVEIVRLEVLAQNSETLSILSDFLPVSLNVLQVLREVCIRPLEDLAVDGRYHLRLDVNVCFVCLCGVLEDKVGCVLYGLQEIANLLWLLGSESVIGCEKLKHQQEAF